MDADLERSETEKEIRQFNALVDLAKSGNLFAKYQLKFQQTQLPVNVEALMSKECRHYRILPNGAQIKATAVTKRQSEDGFLVLTQICVLCGKEIEKTIISAKGW